MAYLVAVKAGVDAQSGRGLFRARFEYHLDLGDPEQIVAFCQGFRFAGATSAPLAG
jgi:hypothetical protein